MAHHWDTGQPRPHTIPTALRRQILKRANGICYVCGQPDANQVDHKTPRHQGGTDHPTNLGAIHDRPCHQAKTQAEAQAARALPPKARPAEQHPGLTTHPPQE